MAEDPRTKAYNEEMRRKKISDEKEAQRLRNKKAEEEMRARMSRDHKRMLEKTTGGSSGCAIVLAVMTGAPLALAAFRWIA